MAQYIFKAKDIEAVQWIWPYTSEFPEWLTKALLDTKVKTVMDNLCIIGTYGISEPQYVYKGDYLVRIEGELFAITKDSFESNYVRVGK